MWKRYDETPGHPALANELAETLVFDDSSDTIAYVTPDLAIGVLSPHHGDVTLVGIGDGYLFDTAHNFSTLDEAKRAALLLKEILSC